MAQKIAPQVAEESYLKCVVRAELNIKQLRFVEDAKQDLRARLLRQKVEEKLRAGQKRFRQIPLVTAWQQQFADELDRYRFLVSTVHPGKVKPDSRRAWWRQTGGSTATVRRASFQTCGSSKEMSTTSSFLTR